ncbi:serine--tRNA ligase [Aquicella lusitana]|uniref:Serine--tRNA ligase n=1 Tax=Aquicella lusitana TaxID=254246 RepID=A0A370GK16_9COXI|nr:serine--tRNA ligase [Aquicella lusitana]RDI42734.1 seryl-tRNA synthetase [Aquicella lusitana]VVC73411.1 Serine--tRNA ligase [Aquicella lusitana]
MLDPKLVRNDINEVAAQLKKRGFVVDTTKFNTLEEQRKHLQVKLQEMQNERNVRSKEVGMAKAAGKNVDEVLAKLKDVSEAIKSLEAKFAQTQTELDDFLAGLPNIPHASVPFGKSEDDNEVVRVWGEPRQFSFKPKDHVELGANQGWIDFETAAALSGSRFVVLRGPMARLQRALIQFMLDLHINEHGYQEILVPYIVNADCLFGTGQLPKFKEDLFAVNGEGERYLISTSEIPVTNTVRDSIVNADQLPIKYACYSSCFRSEAGSYGKDIRGMLRQHQFEKVELVQIVQPAFSYEALEELTRHAETVLQRLELPYRVVALCTADIGFSAAKTYDLEVWLPGQNRYREISSCSNTESFQARRMKARWRDESGKIDLVHTLNGSGLAIGRTLIAVVENYQDELGRIHIPPALQPYMGGLEVIE